jgi:argininosuccinate lyase
MLDGAAEEVIGRPLGLDERLVKSALDPFENVRIRSVVGGPAPDEVRRMIDVRTGVLAQDQGRLAQRRARLAEAADGLRAAVSTIMRSRL